MPVGMASGSHCSWWGGSAGGNSKLSDRSTCLWFPCSNISITINILYCITCYLIKTPTSLAWQGLSLLADMKACRTWHRHTSCSTQGAMMGNWLSELDPNAVAVHGSLLFCGWPLSLGVFVIYAGEGTSHRVDHVQTHPHTRGPQSDSASPTEPEVWLCQSSFFTPWCLDLCPLPDFAHLP